MGSTGAEVVPVAACRGVFALRSPWEIDGDGGRWSKTRDRGGREVPIGAEGFGDARGSYPAECSETREFPWMQSADVQHERPSISTAWNPRTCLRPAGRSVFLPLPSFPPCGCLRSYLCPLSRSLNRCCPVALYPPPTAAHPFFPSPSSSQTALTQARTAHTTRRPR